MSEYKYIKINTSVHTASNKATLLKNAQGDVEAKISLNFAENFLSIPKTDILSLDLETTRMQLSLRNMPICVMPLNKALVTSAEFVSTCQLDVWPFCWLDDNRISPTNVSDSAFPYYVNRGDNSLFNISFPSNLEDFPEVSSDSISIKNIGTLEQIFQDAIENAITFAASDSSTTPPTIHLSTGVKPKISFEDRSLSLSYDTAAFTAMQTIPILWNQSFINNYETPQKVRDELGWYEPPPKRVYSYNVTLNQDRTYNFAVPENMDVQPFNIVVNRAFRDTFNFLPWITVNTRSSAFSQSTILPNVDLDENGCFYLLDCTTLKFQTSGPEPVAIPPDDTVVGNVRITCTWDNIPLVSMTPISSIILKVDGLDILTPEIQPVNLQTQSSITQSIPVIENYYIFAQSLADLHDDLIVTRDQFDANAKYSINPTAGLERLVSFTAHYITKNGVMKKIFIPPNGVFILQLTFRATVVSSK